MIKGHLLGTSQSSLRQMTRIQVQQVLITGVRMLEVMTSSPQS